MTPEQVRERCASIAKRWRVAFPDESRQGRIAGHIEREILQLDLGAPEPEGAPNAGTCSKIETIIFLHETSYYQGANWNWTCVCGAGKVFATREECVAQTRKHWAETITVELAMSAEPYDWSPECVGQAAETLKFIRQCVSGRCNALDLGVIRDALNRYFEPSAPTAAPERCPTCGSDDKTIHRAYQCGNADCICINSVVQHDCYDPWHNVAEQPGKER